jgi:hypothetical protein
MEDRPPTWLVEAIERERPGRFDETMAELRDLSHEAGVRLDELEFRGGKVGARDLTWESVEPFGMVAAVRAVQIARWEAIHTTKRNEPPGTPENG